MSWGNDRVQVVHDSTGRGHNSLNTYVETRHVNINLRLSFFLPLGCNLIEEVEIGSGILKWMKKKIQLSCTAVNTP